MQSKKQQSIDDIKFKAIFDSALEGILLTKQDGSIAMANTGCHRLFGYEEGELIGQQLEILIPDQFKKGHVHHRNSFHSSPTPRSMGIGIDLRGLRKDGSEFPLEVSLSYVEQDNTKWAIAFIIDISERKKQEKQLKEYSEKLEEKVKQRTQKLEEVNTTLEKQVEDIKNAEEAVRRSEATYKMIARNYPNGTINVFDRELKYLFVEGKELFELGITGDKLIGTYYLARLDKQIRAIAEKELMEVFKGQARTFEIAFQDNYYVLNAVPLLEEEGKITQILVVEKNITQQKRAEKEMRKALDKERELGELKSRFVTMASHEFRTPLATISSSSTLIGKYVKEDQQEKRLKHVNRIQSNVRHLTGVLNDFLSLGKLEEGQVENNPVNLNLKELIEGLLEEMQVNLKNGQHFQYEHQNIEEYVCIDGKLLRNSLINLISNAIKYSPEGKAIELTSLFQDSQLNISVKDSGIGIPVEDHEHLFSRFFRAHNTGNIKGTGMGLHIVKKYLDLMGGKITFESALNAGTTFIITFDLTPA